MISTPFRIVSRPSVAFVGALTLLAAANAHAQVTPAAGYTPPDDTPSVKIGGVIYTNYTYQDTPTAKDADGNTINPSSFDVGRAYINVTGQINHWVSFRITPDVSGHFTTTTTSTALPTGSSVTASTSYDGSLVYRLKYAFGQVNFDDFLTKGSWARLGEQQTPIIDYLEGIYRYRFQGTVFAEREGFLTSSDFGLSGHYNLPNNYGDIHAGVYNGDGYSKGEANDQKAFQVRGTLRPFPMGGVWKGVRLTAFYDADKYVKGADRKRFIGDATFEHKSLNLGFEYVDAKDQTSITKSKVSANGYSIWATPRSNVGLEALIRYDSLKPNTDVDARKNRLILGGSYWFKTTASSVSAALLADYEHVTYDTALAKPNETRYALHALFTF